MAMSSRSPGTVLWDRIETATAYARFSRACPMYREVAEAMVARVARPGDAMLVDLGAGTGVCTEALAAQSHSGARIWAVEPAAAMLAQARTEVHDPRVRWLLGDVRSLARLRPPRSVDAITSNASLWLDPDPIEALSVAAELLHDRGRLGFTMPAEYLGDIAHLLTPEARAFAGALEEVRALALEAAPRRGPRAVDTPEAPLPPNPPDLHEALAALGYGDIAIEGIEIVITADDRARWYGLPPFLENWLPGLSAERRMAAVRLLIQRAAALPPMVQVWNLVTARRGA